MYRVGIFGGAFNPPHNGHVNLAKNAIDELHLKELLIIPTGQSPHKEQPEVGFDLRFQMAELAFAEVRGATISDIEKHIRGKSYTINTLRELKKRYPPKTEFCLIIGSDMLYTFTSWFKYESILKECKVFAAARDNGEYADMMEEATAIGRISVMNSFALPMSSTKIRNKISRSEDTGDCLSREVLDFISNNNLYKRA